MRLLELFSGTKSISKAVGEQFTEVISVDMVNKYKPTILTDILKWDYTVYPPGHFHTIWASPPCTEYSMLNQSIPHKTPNLTLADSIVQKTIEIIEYFKPHRWYMENPQSGTLKDRVFMWGVPYYDIDYCAYAMWGYRKRTRIWTNVENFDAMMCSGRGKCPNMIDARHRIGIGCGYGVTNLAERYRIPEKLVTDLFKAQA
jgi:site-specific DNA-cytosine methylase